LPFSGRGGGGENANSREGAIPGLEGALGADKPRPSAVPAGLLRLVRGPEPPYSTRCWQPLSRWSAGACEERERVRVSLQQRVIYRVLRVIVRNGERENVGCAWFFCSAPTAQTGGANEKNPSRTVGPPAPSLAPSRLLPALPAVGEKAARALVAPLVGAQPAVEARAAANRTTAKMDLR